QGNLLWVEQWGHQPYNTAVYATLTLDNEENIIITSNFRGVWDLDPGPDEVLVGNPNNAQLGQFFILKVDEDGNFIWGKEISGEPILNNNVRAIDKSDGLQVDGQNNVHIAGKFSGTVDFDPDITTYEVTSHQLPNGSYQTNSFVLSLDAEGNFLEVNTLISEGNNFITSIVLDSQGNFIYVGKFFEALDVDFGAGEYILPTPNLEEEFILKYDSNNNFIWAKVIGSGPVYCLEYINYVHTDSNDNILLGGSFIGGSFDADPGPDEYILNNLGDRDCFIIKLDQNGEFLWAYAFGSESQERIVTIAIDDNDFIYNQGYFLDTIDFDPTGNEDLIIPTSTLGYSAFIQKLSPDGEYYGITTIDSYGDTDVLTQDINVDNNNDLILYGLFRGTVDFDPGPDVLSITSNNESVDLFVLKLGQLPLSTEENIFVNQPILYPNPTKGRIDLNLRENYKDITIQITDITGKNIQTINPESSKIIPIEIQGVSGLYFVTVTADNKKTVLKLIKE
ncbi:MAG: T9SS type A sorting domain-containing protein, partial [Aequorivita sp.]|nr:T9SS type A sorting domain-containing protein [Aequorivita sp.]